MAKFDFSGDGFIQFDGFVMLLIKIKQLTAAFEENFSKFIAFFYPKHILKSLKSPSIKCGMELPILLTNNS